MCKKCGCETTIEQPWGVYFAPCSCPKNIDKEIDKALAILEKKLKTMGLSDSA